MDNSCSENSININQSLEISAPWSFPDGKQKEKEEEEEKNPS